MNRRIRVMFGVLRKKLTTAKFTIGKASNDIGEGTTAVYPEMPLLVHDPDFKVKDGCTQVNLQAWAAT